jgi:hypothetical protein
VNSQVVSFGEVTIPTGRAEAINMQVAKSEANQQEQESMWGG